MPVNISTMRGRLTTIILWTSAGAQRSPQRMISIRSSKAAVTSRQPLAIPRPGEESAGPPRGSLEGLQRNLERRVMGTVRHSPRSRPVPLARDHGTCQRRIRGSLAGDRGLTLAHVGTGEVGNDLSGILRLRAGRLNPGGHRGVDSPGAITLRIDDCSGGDGARASD
jgi:hypothetical protein